MNRFNQLIRSAISMMPRSRSIGACCSCYADHCRQGQEPSDMHTNGELRLLRELAPRLSTVFDVGANVGDWTGLFLRLRPGARIHAFEPTAGAYGNFIRQSFPPNVTLHRIALSSECGSAEMHIFGESSGLNSLHNRNGLEEGHGIVPATGREETRLETVDVFCVANEIKCVDFVKIDTEGHEVDVLLGSRECLAGGVLRCIQFEYGGTWIDSRRLLKDVFDLFGDLDYVIFLIVPAGLVAFPRYDQRLEDFQYKNFVAIHRDAIAITPSALRALDGKP